MKSRIRRVIEIELEEDEFNMITYGLGHAAGSSQVTINAEQRKTYEKLYGEFIDVQDELIHN